VWICWALITRVNENLYSPFSSWTIETNKLRIDNTFLYTVYRYAKLQVFEANVMKYIIDWQHVKMIEVSMRRSCCATSWRMFIISLKYQWLTGRPVSHLAYWCATETGNKLTKFRFFRSMNWSHITTHLVLLLVVHVGVTSSKKPKAPSFQIGSGWNLAGLFFTLRLTESDFLFDVVISRWRPWRHFTQQSAAAWWVHTQRLPSTYTVAAPVSSCNFLTYSTFVFVLCKRSRLS